MLLFDCFGVVVFFFFFLLVCFICKDAFYSQLALNIYEKVRIEFKKKETTVSVRSDLPAEIDKIESRPQSRNAISISNAQYMRSKDFAL